MIYLISFIIFGYYGEICYLKGFFTCRLPINEPIQDASFDSSDFNFLNSKLKAMIFLFWFPFLSVCLFSPSDSCLYLNEFAGVLLCLVFQRFVDLFSFGYCSLPNIHLLSLKSFLSILFVLSLGSLL